MGSSSGNSQPNTVVTTQNKDPWSGAQQPLKDIYAAAGNLYNSGYEQPYSGPVQADMHPMLSGAINNQWGMAADGLPGVNAARGLAQDIVGNQGITAGQQGAIQGLGQVNAQYGNLWNAAEGQENPYLQSVINDNNRKISDRINSSMSGAGRYGSASHEGVAAREMAAAANPLLAQDYQNRQQMKLQATQGSQGLFGQLSDIYSKGLNQAGQFSQLMPGLDQARFADQDRLMSLGQYLTGRDQADLAGRINYYNAQQSYPWENLARYNAILGGAGQLGGTQTTAQPVQQPSGLQSAFGGALAGAGLGSIFGPVGAGVGAAGGGLLGLLNR